MLSKAFIAIAALIFSVSLQAQNPLEKLESLIGKWEGTGEGFGNSKSNISAEYNWLMDRKFIEVKHHSAFAPTAQNSKGEIHDDWGMISFNKERSVVVFRQYHSEGFFNEYILNTAESNDSTLVFETERIENFVPGGRARFTIRLKAENEIETVFDVGFPGKELACFGTNRMKKK
ncbi:hypothetical protein [Maribellus sp. YY47]|uniref:hypothetical protein n=1 Tax=Maribellus sp. YY47 TaxID=2929486 RepID=UPI0020009305|nr:hypothetical protein [Maribellus sp. YY47]MCK3682604.1 hypothetical protein [Maribellus sp. YY47]